MRGRKAFPVILHGKLNMTGADGERHSNFLRVCMLKGIGESLPENTVEVTPDNGGDFHPRFHVVLIQDRDGAADPEVFYQPAHLLGEIVFSQFR